MYKYILFSLIGISLFSCQSETKSSYTINAEIDTTANGKLARLMTLEGRNQVLKDSTRIANGKLSFKGKADSPELYFISVDGYRGNTPFILENTDYEIKMNADSLYTSTVSGSEETKLFKEYQDFVGGLSKMYQKSFKEYQERRMKNDSLDPNYMRKVSDSLLKLNEEFDLKFINENKDNAIAALLLEQLYNNRRMDESKVVELYEAFPEDVKATRVGKDLAKAMETAVGKMAPDFSAPDQNGSMVNLNDVKGKVTIIDFWASWSKPSRAENPNLSALYKKYHDQGLEIIGVSLDGAQQQSGAKEAWVEAIEEDSLTWPQVSNIKYFEDPVALKYNVTKVPSIFIVDASGKIAAKNLQGSELAAKIEELLK